MTDHVAPHQERLVDNASAAHEARVKFRALYDAEIHFVWNRLQRLGVPSRDVPDAAHEVFIVVHKLFAEIDWSRPLRPWLFAISVRVAAQYRRKSANKNEVLTDEQHESQVNASAEQQLESREKRALIEEALRSIDIDRRPVFMLHELDETPIPEIAKLLDIPLNTAYSRLRLAREEFNAAVKRLAPKEVRDGKS